MVLKIQASSLPYKGDINVSSLLLDDKKELRTKALSQYVMIETQAIGAKEDYTISLSRYETVLRPLSLWVSSQSERHENIRLTLENVENDVRKKVFSMHLNRVEIPYIFPDVILLPSNELTIKPTYDIDNCFIFLEPAYLLDHYKLQVVPPIA